MSVDLAARRCEPCEGGTEPLTGEQADELLRALHADWSLSEEGLGIARIFRFPEYDRTLEFANAAAQLAIVEDHHPVLTVAYGSCTVSYTTHSINGLSDNDFICAAKTDRIVEASGA